MGDLTLGIQRCFERVKGSASRAMPRGAVGPEDPSFQDIFALNNEIGKLARSHPERAAELKEVQGDVNMITVGLKYGRREDVVEGLALTEKAISAFSASER